MTQTTDRLAKVLRPVAVMHTHKTHLTEIEEYRNGSACLAPGDKAVGWKETLLYSEKDMQSLSTELAKAQQQLKTVLDREAETHRRHDAKVDVLEGRIAELEAENARLREALIAALRFLDCAPLESGTCCCGDPIEGHGYYSGHSPVDEVVYRASQVADELRAALNPQPTGKESGHE